MKLRLPFYGSFLLILLALPGNIQCGDLISAGLKVLQNRDFDRAIEMANGALLDNPGNSDAHHLKTFASWGKQDYVAVVRAVAEAEVRGILTAELFQKQAEAFFLLGAYEPCLQALAKIEKLEQP